MKYTLSQRLSHFFHVVSNIRPMVWVGIYVCTAPVFALIYWALPDSEFRVPAGDVPGYGSWLYYSIVTVTTLGFGDYTPAQGWAQAVTAVEVTCGLVVMGLFLNSVGAMKSEIDVESEIEKQKALHRSSETEKLRVSMPMIIHTLNSFLDNCNTFNIAEKANPAPEDEKNVDLRHFEKILHSAGKTSLALDSLQQRIDLTLWPDLLEDCFAFVANYQMFSNIEHKRSDYIDFVKENEEIAKKIDAEITTALTTQ